MEDREYVMIDNKSNDDNDNDQDTKKYYEQEESIVEETSAWHDTKQLFWKDFDQKTAIFSNLSSSLSVCLMSFPVVLSLVLSIDDRVKEANFKPSIGILSLLVGFGFSFLYTGGNNIYKGFTGIFD